MRAFLPLSINWLLNCFLLLSCPLVTIGATAAEPGCGINLQDRVRVRGTVIDKATKAPIPFAHIAIISKNRGAQTDEKGGFVLLLHPGDKLRISSLGYVSREFSVESLLRQPGEGGAKLFLEPKQQSLQAVEVKAKAQNWKARKIGYHIEEGATFHHSFIPSDTLATKEAGKEIGNRIRVKRKPGVLQSVSFGLAGSGNAAVKVGVKLYSIKNNLPHRNMLPQPVLIRIEPHHTGWITVDLTKYNLTVKEDFALVIEWLSETTQLNRSSLMAFATLPKGQVTYYRAERSKPWRTLDSKLLDVKSIGMYATLLY